jgi:hypothetical protein
MSLIHVARDHRPYGTCNEEDLREGIRSGNYVASDLVWREGMAEWKPLSEMAPQWSMDMPAPALIPPAVPTSAMETSVLPPGSEPAWEERDLLGLFTAISRTVGSVLMRPTATFAALRQTGGLSHPLLYFVLVSSVMFAVSAFYQMAATTMNPQAFPASFPQASRSAFSVALIGSILLSPALYVVSAFLSSGLTHLCLKLLGGAHRPFETTFRVICYAQASAAVLNLLPLCGSLIGIIWGAYCIIIGLRETHRISGWKATLAITLPGILCCAAVVFLFTAAGISIAEIGKSFGGLSAPTKP